MEQREGHKYLLVLMGVVLVPEESPKKKFHKCVVELGCVEQGHNGSS